MTWVQTVQAVIVAVIGLVVFTFAAVAVALPKVLKNAKDIQELWNQFREHQTKDASTPQPSELAEPATDAPAVLKGGTAGRVPSLASLPRWSQRKDLNPDGSVPMEAGNDCGEECIAMIYRSTRGVEVEADYLRYLIKGPTGSGVTSGDDLATLLRHAFYSPRVLLLAGPEALSHLVAATTQRVPVVALGTWVSLGFLHWVVIMSITGDSVTYMDPWFGSPVTVSSQTFMERYRGILVDCGEPVAYPPAAQSL